MISKKFNKIISEISIFICNKNSLRYLKISLPKLKKINFKEIVVVDGISTDGSIEFVKKNKIKLVSDFGKGLSYSRKIASNLAKGRFLLILGPDDLIEKKDIYKIFQKFISSNFDAATMKLKIQKKTSAWDEYLQFWFSVIRKTGNTNVIGTPTIFKKKLFKKVSYKKNTIGYDDTDISKQLIENGFKIGVLNCYCNQVNNNQYNDVYKKFYLYGVSDRNYYKRYRKKFSIVEKLGSVAHPLHNCLKQFKSINDIQSIKFIPYILLTLYLRYKGFFNL